MAIFTNTANYLKCRNYFENVLGFKVITPEQYEAKYNEWGVFANIENISIARNIWFFYSKALAWSSVNPETGETDYPPKELESGFVIKPANGELDYTDYCGFVLDETGSTEDRNFEFIGAKRLLPIEKRIKYNSSYYVDADTLEKQDGSHLQLEQEDITEGSDLDLALKEYKDVIQFRMLTEGKDKKKLSNYNVIAPLNSTLNTSQPNTLKITTSYEYDDFGFKEKDREYAVRQIGMVTSLCVPSSSYSVVNECRTLFNGMEYEDVIYYLCNLLNITDLSKQIPANLDVYKRDLGVSESFLGVLQFYVNTLANTRVTYQIDYYNFIVSFENKLECSCTCEDCICNEQ